MTTLVSIIIPTFNRAHLLGETLDSVILQTYQNWECIVVDDGSTDYTSQLLESYIGKDSRINFYKRPHNRSKGANVCRNIGIELSSGSYCIFLDSDDLLSVNCLQNRIRYFYKNPAKDFIVFSMGKFTSLNNKYSDQNPSTYYLNNSEYIDQFLKGPLPWNITRPIFKRNFLMKTNGFDEDLLRFQDVEFNIRLLHRHKPSILLIDHTDCYYRSDDHQNRKYNDKTFKKLICNEYYKYCQKIVYLLDNDLNEKRKLLIQLNLINLIKGYSNSLSTFISFIKLIFFYQKSNIINFRQGFNLIILLFLSTFWKFKKGYHKISKSILKDL